MGEWIEELAVAAGQPPLTPDETEGLLRVAREVAHRVERKATPLAAFLLGLDVARRMTSGDTRVTAIEGAIAELDRLLPAPDGG